MKFLKQNSYDIVKLFVNQMGIMIFSLVLYTAVSIDGIGADLHLTLKILVSVFATLFYFALIYTAAWDMGAKDIIRIEGGRAERVPFKGGILSLVANFPNFILTAVALIVVLCSDAELAVDLPGAFATLNLIFRFLLSMYTGIIQGIFDFLPAASSVKFLYETVGFLVLPLLSVGVTQLGYAFGMRGIRIFGFVSPKKQNKE